MHVIASQYKIILPELFLSLSLSGLLMIDVFLKSAYKWMTYYLTQLSLIVALFMVVQQQALNIQPTIIFSGHYVLDSLAITAKLFIYLFGIFALIGMRSYVKQGNAIAMSEHYIISLFALCGMSMLSSANSFIMVYLSLELLSLSLYALVALQKQSIKALEAAIKYFILGALASGLLLYGISILYGLTGQVVFAEIGKIGGLSFSSHRFLALIFILSALAFKLGVVPFHMWVPDVYQGASAPATLFLSSVPKVALLAVIIRILSEVMPALHELWQNGLIILAILSMLVGNVLAIMQVNFKRMLAYSSVAQAGYVLLGVLAGPNSPSGYSFAMFYVVTYAIAVMGAFSILIFFSRQGIELDQIEDYRGLNTHHPWLAFMLLLLIFSMAGIPLTVGFFAKLGLLVALVQAKFLWLAVLALLFSVIGAYYYLRVIMIMYFKDPVHLDGALSLSIAKLKQGSMLSSDLFWMISVYGLATLLFGLFPSALMNLCHITV